MAQWQRISLVMKRSPVRTWVLAEFLFCFFVTFAFFPKSAINHVILYEILCVFTCIALVQVIIS